MTAPTPDATPLLPAPPEPLLLAAPTPKWKTRIKPITAAVLAAVLILAFAVGWFVHHRRASAAAESNDEARSTIPIITVVPVQHSAALSELLLPGSLSPITEASLYARASGYVRKRYVDIGDSVTAGQVLAEIDSPELDLQVAQGRASLAQARQQAAQAEASVGDAQARLDLARVTVQRYETLLAQDSIARQDVDVQRQTVQSAIATLVSSKASVGAAQEAVRAAKANVDRLIALQGFEKLRAPFAGIITVRNVDEGTLISGTGASLSTSSSGGSTSAISSSSSTGTSGSSSDTSGSSGSSSSGSSSGGSGVEMFRIAQVDRLRVYVNVPQENAGAVQIGTDAGVFIQQFEQRFVGRVARTAQAIDTASRTLLTEVQIANAEHTLMPGMYAQVRFSSARSNPPLLVPGEALIARANGTSVATLVPLADDEQSKLDDPADRRCARKIRLQPVSLGRDYGTQVEITRGLRAQDFVVLNPSDTVRENAVMLPQLQKKQDDQGGSSSGSSGGGSSGSSGGASGGKPGASAAGGGSASGSAKGGEKGGDKSGDAKQGSASPGGGSKKDDPKARQAAEKQRRQAAQQTCIEDQAQQAAAQAPQGMHLAPAGESPASGAGAGNTPPGGSIDNTPPGGSINNTPPGGSINNTPPGGSINNTPPGGDSDRAPAGIQSPSMQAPTQGGQGSGKAKKT